MSKRKIYAESMFIDSGAHSLYNIHVLKSKGVLGKHGKLLLPPTKWGGTDPSADFSYYDLTKGSPFRAYCVSYASFMKVMKGKGVLLANVDAIGNPALTWEIQRFFEEEHGVQPMPIVHCHTPLKWVDKYLEAGRYDLLGVGGLGQGITRSEYFGWADEFFLHICPKSNGYLPIIKTHGFAMTSWELMSRWPWWSVDSATWVKLSAYGWLYVPRERNGKFRFDRPPMVINFSKRPPKKRKEERGGQQMDSHPSFKENPAPRETERLKHYDNIVEGARRTVDRWLKHVDVPMGSVDEQGEMKEFGIVSHHRARSIANLIYLKDLEESRPEWPHPLDDKLVHQTGVDYMKGCGF